MSRATWNPAADIDGPLSNQEPTEYDVVELFAGDEQRTATAMAVIVATPQHRYRALADRIDVARESCKLLGTEILKSSSWSPYAQRMSLAAAKLLPGGCPAWVMGAALDAPWPIPNIMLGVRVRTQAEADARLPALAEIPARWRFVRLKPSEAIDFTLHGSRVQGWDEDVSANMLTGEWWTSPRQDEPSEGVGLDLVEVAAGSGPVQLQLVQSIGGQALDAQRWAPCADEECAAGARVDCHRCGNTAEQLVSGPALAIVAESTDPAKVSPVVDIPGHGMRSWNQRPPGWLL